MDHLVTVSAPFLADHGERETGQFTVGANDEAHARNLVKSWLEEEERISSVVASDTSNIPIGKVILQKTISPRGIKSKQ